MATKERSAVTRKAMQEAAFDKPEIDYAGITSSVIEIERCPSCGIACQLATQFRHGVIVVILSAHGKFSLDLGGLDGKTVACHKCGTCIVSRELFDCPPDEPIPIHVILGNDDAPLPLRKTLG